MCGRYASSRRAEDLVEEFEVDVLRIAEPLEPDYNVAPTKDVYAVVERPPSKEHAERSEQHDPEQHDPGQDGPERQLRVVRWGLVPSWAKDASIGNRMINARMETVAEKPAYKRAFAKRRCLLPADGYFEWYPTQQTTKAGKPLKQPFFIRPRDGGSLAMAGLYEIWRDPARPDDDPDRFLWSCTVITTDAEDELGHIHDRMPLMVERDRWSAWLDPTASQGTLLDLLVPAAPGALEAFPVSREVSNVRNNGPSLVEPLPLEEVVE
ncbi:SOS response-associated peptidase [Nocardioides sp. Arc9.136]|uniref:SOS response-associated peptidase n=1 Tax=Nocardioides sp. Arc9.136 TaxID=2996826 RepID=UPI002665B780|nr:SOS response-associated peptidase [Nocardioides sp. Arc9.136]WKN47375.1 SOS response-associated peptidase [Nocardioides sp. Arc9.136]